MGEYVDIIIVNYNTLHYLQKCIKSIETQTRYPYRLCVIDNNSQDGSRAFLKSLLSKGVQVIFNQKNQGCAKAWNQGIKATRGKYLLFLNPDTLVSPGWLTGMVNCMNTDPLIAVVGNKQVNDEGIIIHAGVVYEDNHLVFRGYGEEDNPELYPQVTDCVDVCGACYLIRRSVLGQIGLFDERFFVYAEETDFSFRARASGFRVVYCPVTIVHFKDGTPISEQQREMLHLRSARLFDEKWGGRSSEC